MITISAKWPLKVLKYTAVLLLIISTCIVVARWVFKLPVVDHSTDLKPTSVLADTYLSQQFKPVNANHQGLTGIKVLSDGMDAFTIRMFLIKHAMQSIDAQYYIWHKDLTGLLLLSALKEAADRGVQVRLLLDDNGIDGLDEIIAELNQHPLIDIRLYNPFMIRGFKVINFTFDFFRLNRRMHNKALIVDGVAAVSGGRNIGDQYFGTGEHAQFVDLDILTVGQVIPSMLENFAVFFNSEVSIPAELILHPTPSGTQFYHLANALSPFVDSEQFASYTSDIKSSQFLLDILNGQFIDEWTKVTMISDDPRKTLGIHYEDELMVTRLNAILDSPETKIDVVSPYFVPGDGVEVFTNLQAKGVNVRILTNAFEATDVVPVHSGYAKYRQQLLAAEVQLFELKAHQINKDKGLGIVGSSASSLHAKTFAVDEQLTFIGSFNFDPRSTMLNTEMGVLIKSEKLANRIHQHFDDKLPNDAYTLSLNEANKIIWREKVSESTYLEHSNDPNSTWQQRAFIKLLGLLPIQSLL